MKSEFANKSGPVVVPPWSESAERSLLSMVLLVPGNVIPELRRECADAAFFSESHQAVWRHAVASFEAGEMDGQALSLVSLAERLRLAGVLEKIGGVRWVNALADYEPGAEGWRSRWDIVRRWWRRRRMAAVGQALQFGALDASVEAETVLAEAEAGLFALHSEEKKKGPEHVVFHTEKAVEHLQQLIQSRGLLMGLPTGLTDVDRVLGGLMAKKFYVLAARPGVGKTVLEQIIAENIARGTGHYAEMARMRERGVAGKTPVLLVSLEVDGVQLMLRRVLANSQTPLTLLRSGFFPKGWMEERAVPVAMQLADSALWIWDAHDLSVADVRAEARRWLRRAMEVYPPPENRPSGVPNALICIDHIGLLNGSPQAARLGRTAEVTEISKSLLHMAKELDVPVLALSQLNRETEKKGSGRPTLANLRDSGAIEQDADVAMLLLRPSDYDKETDFTVRDCLENRLDASKPAWVPPGGVMPGQERSCELLKLIVAKHRGGPTGDIDLAWEKAITQIHSLTGALYSNDANKHQQTQ